MLSVNVILLLFKLDKTWICVHTFSFNVNVYTVSKCFYTEPFSSFSFFLFSSPISLCRTSTNDDQCRNEEEEEEKEQEDIPYMCHFLLRTKNDDNRREKKDIEIVHLFH